MDGSIITFGVIFFTLITIVFLIRACTLMDGDLCPNDTLPAHKAGSQAGSCASCRRINKIANEAGRAILIEEARKLHRPGCTCRLCKPKEGNT